MNNIHKIQPKKINSLLIFSQTQLITKEEQGSYYNQDIQKSKEL